MRKYHLNRIPSYRPLSKRLHAIQVRKGLTLLQLLEIQNPYGDSTKTEMPSTGGSGRVFFPVSPKAYIIDNLVVVNVPK